MKIKFYFTLFILFSEVTFSFSQHISAGGSAAAGDIYHLSGKIGVGTSSPTQKLHVQGGDILIKHPTGNSLHFRTDSQDSYINNMNNFAGNGSTGNGNLVITGQQDIYFKTGNVGGSGAFRMILKNDGKVGIGTSSPNAALEVNGNIVSRTGYFGALNPNNTSALFSLSWLNDVARIRVGGDGVGAANGFDIQGPGNASLLRVKQNGIGIGTNDPSAKLDVVGTGSAGTHTATFSSTFGSYSADYDQNRPVTIRRSSSNNEALHIYTQDAATYFTYKNDEAVSKIHFRMINTDTEAGGGTNANDNYVMSIKGDKDGGAVSIGMGSTPTGYKLSVDGKAIMEEVVVQLSNQWPDYVFNSDYELKSLEEVDKYIEDNGHLPNVPSAKEVEENGISLGEMNRLLLEKVEELTLYLIKKEKEIDDLNIRLKRLENE